MDDKYYEVGGKLDGKLEILNFRSISTENTVVIAGNADYVGIKKKCSGMGIENVYFFPRISYGAIYNNVAADYEYPGNSVKNLKLFLADDISIRNLYSFIEAIRQNDVGPILRDFRKQSYFNNDILSGKKGQVLCDIGAYTGDTIRDYVKTNDGNIGRIYAFEGCVDNNVKLEKFVGTLSQGVKDKILTFNMCLWDEVKRVNIQTADACQSDEEKVIFSDASGQQQTVILDSVLEMREKINLLKVNFPGSYNVLKGLEELYVKTSLIL